MFFPIAIRIKLRALLDWCKIPSFLSPKTMVEQSLFLLQKIDFIPRWEAFFFLIKNKKVAIASHKSDFLPWPEDFTAR